MKHGLVYILDYVSLLSVQVNANGVVSFSYPFVESSVLLFPLTGDDVIIAPFWADVDITGTGDIYYRQTTDSGLLARANSEIQKAFPAAEDVSIQNLLIATWDRVGYYPQQTDKVRIIDAIALQKFQNRTFVMLYI